MSWRESDGKFEVSYLRSLCFSSCVVNPAWLLTFLVLTSLELMGQNAGDLFICVPRSKAFNVIVCSFSVMADPIGITAMAFHGQMPCTAM